MWSLALGLLLGAGVAFPFARRGWLLTLDWVAGPHAKIPLSLLGHSALGTSMPLQLVIYGAGWLVGAAQAHWLVVAAVFPLATCAAGHLVGGSVRSRLAAGALYALNPIVFERLAAGQVFFLVGYALLPFFARSLLDAEGRRGLDRYRPAIWLAACVAASVHYAWMGGLLVLAVVLWRHRWSTTRWALGVLVLTALLGAYALVPAWGHGIGVTVGPRNLLAYRTRTSHRFGLLVNVVGLYGFWRRGPVLPKDVLRGWPLILLAIMVVVAAGAVRRWRAGRHLEVGMLATAGAVGCFLAMGSQGPTAAVFRALYDYLPGFDVMREPQKFAALLALAYAAFFGTGADVLAQRAAPARWQPMAVSALALCLPLAYTPTIFAGLGGQLRVSEYPPSWSEANRIMGAGQGAVLFLPWEQYLAFPFTHGQVVANPASQVFSRRVIAGDNVGLPGIASNSTSARGAYLQSLLDQGPHLEHFGRLVAQLGVRYVALAHTVNWRWYDRWLSRQSDLTEVYSSGSITLWRNPFALVQGARLTKVLEVPSLAAYIGLEQRENLVGTAVFVDPRSKLGRGGMSTPISDVRTNGLLSYQVAAGPPGWVVLPRSYGGSWRLNGRPGKRLANGMVAFALGPHAGTARYRGPERVIVGSAISLLALSVLLGGMALQRRHDPGKSRGPQTGPEDERSGALSAWF